ncbi:MAG: hypothetical protein QOE35_3921 [Actinomycetota bacterium]|jgi:uncharacterized protein (DUF1015 family)
MPRFEPFAGLRYDLAAVELDDVIAPPYDVVSRDDQSALEARSPYNSIRVELPRDEVGLDRYAAASRLLTEWRAAGVLVTDDEPSFYVYRMGFHDDDGRPRQTSGVIGALGLVKPGAPGSDVLPHERTTPKAKSDRLDLLRATKANLSPIWGLSLAEGLSALSEPPGPPDGRATDSDGVHHRIWRVIQPGVVAAITEAVASAPVVIADGHHRFETALNYRDEQRAASGDADGPYDLVLAYVVELTEEQLSVRPIHRLLNGLPDDVDLPMALEPFFDVFGDDGPLDGVTTRMADAGALALVTRGGTWLLRPRPQTEAAAEQDLDSCRLDVALAALPPHELTFQHGWDLAAAAVDKGEAQAAVLLRPATVEQIHATGHAGLRMPPKTTFFHPKPRTGLVFRSVAG